MEISFLKGLSYDYEDICVDGVRLLKTPFCSSQIICFFTADIKLIWGLKCTLKTLDSMVLSDFFFFILSLIVVYLILFHVVENIWLWVLIYCCNR